MQVVILCSPEQEQELNAAPGTAIFVREMQALLEHQDADIWMDLLFEDHYETHLPLLQQAGGKTVVVHAVAHTLSGMTPNFVRINAWPTFLNGALIEGCGADSFHQEHSAQAFRLLGKKVEWVPDVPGLVSARIIAMIINEAFFALAEGIATRTDIDTAMRLGTAYPFGPFDWAERIGHHRIAALLEALALSESRYQPCALLMQNSTETAKNS